MSDASSSSPEDVATPTPTTVADRQSTDGAMAQFDSAMAPHLDRLGIGPVNEHHLVSLVSALRSALASALAFLSGDSPAPAAPEPTDRQATIEAAASEPEGVSLASDAAPADPAAPVVTAEPLAADVEPAQS